MADGEISSKVFRCYKVASGGARDPTSVPLYYYPGEPLVLTWWSGRDADSSAGKWRTGRTINREATRFVSSRSAWSVAVHRWQVPGIQSGSPPGSAQLILWLDRFITCQVCRTYSAVLLANQAHSSSHTHAAQTPGMPSCGCGARASQRPPTLPYPRGCGPSRCRPRCCTPGYQALRLRRLHCTRRRCSRAELDPRSPFVF